MDTILMGLSAMNSSPKEPIRANGIVVMIISENFGDSNWIAITTNTRKIPVISAPPRADISSTMLSSVALAAISTPSGISQLRTNSLTAAFASSLSPDWGCMVIDT